MAGLWCKDFPLVTVERSRVPKHVTVIVPYYDNPQFFARQLANWSVFPERLTAHTSLIIVDDCGPVPAVSVVESVLQGSSQKLPVHPRMFRLRKDKRWNWLAARNTGAKEAAPGWLLMTDIDHVIPAETLESVIYGVHRTDTIYGFSRVEHTGEGLAPHPNSFLLTREMFWKVGGYDERLSGFYGTDGDWRRRCAATAPMAILTDLLVRHQFVGDSSTTRYTRKDKTIDCEVKKIIAARGKDWKPLTGSYEYDEVFAQEVVCQ